MSNSTLRNIAIVVGIILFVPAFVISPALGVVFAVILILGFIAAQQMLGSSEVRLKKDDVGHLLNRMWIPVRDELSDVVRTGGKVTSTTSVWTGVPNLYKQEAPTTFHEGMERYVNERAQVAALVASVTATEDSQRQQQIEQQKLLFISRELLEEARKAIYFIQGSETASRQAEAARPRPSVQRPRPATTGPTVGSSAGTRQPSAVSRTAQAQTATPARTIQPRPAPPRPAPATMTSAVETPKKPSAPRPPSRLAPTPMRITPTPTPFEPVVTTRVPAEPESPKTPPAPPSPPPLKIADTPAPPEPEPPLPPSVPPLPSPVTASTAPLSEPAKQVNPPEPVIAAPIPSEPEPVSQPSRPPDDLRLDVASVCEELFDPKMMSYEANRLFDDKYKDATVRWNGTVRRASTYSYDFNFGDGGGTKAELDVYEVKQQYGSRTVKAFVQLPTDAAIDIGARIGEEIEFEGRLMTCEGSARRLYVAVARVVD
ncbi:MAG: hypothetical protein OXD46_15090 [Chloroflexi bacterium]|nr:hypothetical protein [Chloroflexota bacterium]